jgi:hypothetical protein
MAAVVLLVAGGAVVLVPAQPDPLELAANRFGVMPKQRLTAARSRTKQLGALGQSLVLGGPHERLRLRDPAWIEEELSVSKSRLIGRLKLDVYDAPRRRVT